MDGRAAIAAANKCRGFFGSVHRRCRRPAICLRLPERLSSISDNMGPCVFCPMGAVRLESQGIYMQFSCCNHKDKNERQGLGVTGVSLVSFGLSLALCILLRERRR